MIAIRNDGTVIIDTLIDTDGFSKGVNNMQSQLGGVSSSIKKLGAAIGAAFAVKEIIRFGKEAISLGSDLEEVQNVVDVVFGEMSGTINQFANDALEAYGLSVTSAKKYTSTMGAMLKSMGMTTGSAAEMSMQLTGLAGDMASFYNLDPEEAFNKIRAGISGETEPLKQLGINLSVANLEAYALAQGISKSYSAMSQQEQALLRYNYLLSVTADAQGDFARTSGSWANQVRILSERFNQLKATLGQGFMAALTPVIKLLNTLLGYLQKVADAFAAVMSQLFGKVSTNTKSNTGAASQSVSTEANNTTVQEMESVADSYDNAASATDEYRESTKAAAKEVKRSLAGFDELNRLLSEEDYTDNWEDIGNIGNNGSINIPTVDLGESTVEIPEISVSSQTEIEDTVSPKIQAIVDKIQELIAPLKEIDLSPLAEAFDRFKEAVKPITKDLFAGLEWAWHNLLVPLAKWTIEDLLPAFLDLLSAALQFLHTVIEGLKPLAEWLWTNFLQPLAEWTGGMIIDVINGITEALIKISDWITQHQEGINAFIATILSIATAFGVVTMLTNIAAAVKDFVLLASGAQIVMSPLAATIVGWITKIGTFFTKVGSTIALLISKVGAALSYIASVLGVSVGWVAAIVVAVAAAVAAIIIYWDELVLWAQNVGARLQEIWQSILDWIADVKVKYDELKTKIVDWAKKTSQSIKDHFITPIQEWFDDLMQKIREWVENAKENIREAFTKAGQYIEDKFISPVKKWIQNLRDTITQIFDNIKQTIISSIEAAGKAIETRFIEPIQNKFETLREKITNAFQKANDKIRDIFGSLKQWFSEKVLEPIWEAFDNVVDKVIEGLNRMAREIASLLTSSRRRVTTTTKTTRTYTATQTTYAATPRIPYLAKGAVIPPNQKFLAVLGDQKHGTNIEAPLDTIQEAVALVMDDVVQSNLVGFEGVISVLQEILEAVMGIEIGDQVIADAVQRYQRKMAVVRGG